LLTRLGTKDINTDSIKQRAHQAKLFMARRMKEIFSNDQSLRTFIDKAKTYENIHSAIALKMIEYSNKWKTIS
jgi:hypothetical protein